MTKVYGILTGTRYGELLVSCITASVPALQHIANEYKLTFTQVPKKDLKTEAIKQLPHKNLDPPSNFRAFCQNERFFEQQTGYATQENIFLIDITNGLGETYELDLEPIRQKVCPQGILIGLLRRFNFKTHNTEPPSLKKIEEWLERCRNYAGPNEDMPRLFLCDKKPEAFKEYFELGYEIIEPKYEFKKTILKMKCRDKKGDYTAEAFDAFEISGEELPDGITLVAHRAKVKDEIQWVISERSTGLRFPENKVLGSTPTEAVDSVLAYIKLRGMAAIYTAMSIDCDQ